LAKRPEAIITTASQKVRAPDPGCRLLGEAHHLLGALGLVPFQVVVDDQLELLHVEELLGLARQHGLIAQHARLLVLIASGVRSLGFVHAVVDRHSKCRAIAFGGWSRAVCFEQAGVRAFRAPACVPAVILRLCTSALR
jgi:hypothetical protein